MKSYAWRLMNHAMMHGAWRLAPWERKVGSEVARKVGLPRIPEASWASQKRSRPQTSSKDPKSFSRRPEAFPAASKKPFKEIMKN